MTVHHFAYTFDAEAVHEKLLRVVVRNQRLDARLLCQVAQEALANASDAFKAVLNSLRFDPEWLEDPEGDQSQSYLWYLVVLASDFEQCPSLSNNRFHGSHWVLEQVLPLVSWSQQETQLLIHGYFSLETLLKLPKYASIVHSLSLHGGCLKLADIDILLGKLTGTTIDMEQVVLPKHVTEFADLNNLISDRMLLLARLDAIDMLSTASERRRDLYLLRDY